MEKPHLERYETEARVFKNTSPCVSNQTEDGGSKIKQPTPVITSVIVSEL